MITAKQSRYMATAVWLIIVVTSVIYIKHNLKVVSDMQQFMPTDSHNKRLQVLLHETQNGIAANLILVQIKGAAPEYLANLSQKLKISLQKQRDIFVSILNGEQNLDFKSFDSLLEYRYILKHPDDFSIDGLRKNFNMLLTDFRNGASPEIIKYLLSDPQRSYLQYLSAQATQTQPDKINGVWFGADKSKALLMMQLKSTGFNLDSQQIGINAIKNTVKELDCTGMVELDLSGPGTIAVSTRDAIRETIQQVSWILTGVILFLFWFGYRSIRLALFAGIPLITSIIMAIAITQALFGELHGIVLAFGITLLGVCLDYPLHLFSHLRDNEPATSALERILPTLQLGVLTSALAFIAMIGTGFSGLTQLAVFSATGLLVALAVTRWLLPVWVSAAWIMKCSLPPSYPLLPKTKIVVSIAVIGIPLFILLLQDNIWSTDISQISPVPLQVSKTDYKLRQVLHAIDLNHAFLIEGDVIDEVLVETNKIKLLMKAAIEKGLISGIQAATDILPDKFSQKYYQSLLPDKTVLKENVNKAIEGTGLKAKELDGFINAVASSKTRSLVKYENISSYPLGDRLKSMLFVKDHHWYSLIRVTGVRDENTFKTWIKESPYLVKNYISIHESTNILMSNYLHITWKRLLGVLSLIMIIVFWQIKKRKEAAWLIIPVIAGVLVSLAVQTILGNLINIFHVLALLLVVGMGFDYSLFFNRDWSSIKQLEERTHAIIISAITTIIAFAALAYSEIPVLSAMGQTVSIGILTCFIVAHRIAIPKANRKEI